MSKENPTPQERYASAYKTNIMVKINKKTESDLFNALEGKVKQTEIKRLMRLGLQKEKELKLKELNYMKKYLVKSETMQAKAVKGKTFYSEDDLVNDYYCNHNEYEPETLATFDTEEEATAYAEKEAKNLGATTFTDHGNKYIKYDVILVEENEYDDEDEFVDGDSFNIYAPTLDLRDEDDDEDEDED